VKFNFSRNTSFPRTTAEDESSNMKINFSIVVSVPFPSQIQFLLPVFVIKQLQCKPKGKHLKIWCARTSS